MNSPLSKSEHLKSALNQLVAKHQKSPKDSDEKLILYKSIVLLKEIITKREATVTAPLKFNLCAKPNQFVNICINHNKVLA